LRKWRKTFEKQQEKKRKAAEKQARKSAKQKEDLVRRAVQGLDYQGFHRFSFIQEQD
jgi:hypothetical protein